MQCTVAIANRVYIAVTVSGAAYNLNKTGFDDRHFVHSGGAVNILFPPFSSHHYMLDSLVYCESSIPWHEHVFVTLWMTTYFTRTNASFPPHG
jgi:hypothetical protein